MTNLPHLKQLIIPYFLGNCLHLAFIALSWFSFYIIGCNFPFSFTKSSLFSQPQWRRCFRVQSLDLFLYLYVHTIMSISSFIGLNSICMLINSSQDLSLELQNHMSNHLPGMPLRCQMGIHTFNVLKTELPNPLLSPILLLHRLLHISQLQLQSPLLQSPPSSLCSNITFLNHQFKKLFNSFSIDSP